MNSQHEEESSNNFSTKLILQDSLCVFLTYGYDINREKQYVYTAVKGDKLKDFRAAMGQNGFDVTQYGQVLKWGKGDPSPEIIKEMEEKYGLIHNSDMLIPKNEE